MKSKLSLIISALFVALMLVNSASAQRTKSDEGRSDRVYLACEAKVTKLPGNPAIADLNLRFQMTNNTGAWLAEGTIIHFSAEGKDGQQTVIFADNEKMKLDVMVPVNGEVVLLYKFFNTITEPEAKNYGPPFSCKAWFLK